MATSSIPRTSGIYQITCAANGKIYIGSAVNLRERQIEHFSTLRTGKHFNEHLQRTFEKYGSETFTFCIIEKCVRDILLEREQHYLDLLQPFGQRGFNIALNVTAGMDGRQHSMETKAKMKASAKQRSTPEYRASISAKLIGHPGAMKGRKLTPEQVEKVRQRFNKKFVVVSPEGVEIHVNGLSGFCRENNLSQGHMSAVANGKRPHHKGWKCRYVEDET